MKTLKYILILFSFSVMFSNCGGAAYEVTEDFNIVSDNAEFSSKLILIYASEKPDLRQRPSGIDKVKYNVPTWKAMSGADLLVQVKRDVAQQGDGFDDSILSSKTDMRTANLFDAGQNIALLPEKMERIGDTTVIYYQVNEYAEVNAKVFMEGGQLCFASTLTPMKKGYFSLGYLNAPARSIEETQEIWQPLVWQEKRFPDRPYMTLAYRAPIPSTLATFENTTYGIIAHPDEFPFNPLPIIHNSRFGIAVRNDQGEAQAMLFAPALGGLNSYRNAGDSFSFKAILYAESGSCLDNYEKIARTIYGFRDYRRNEISTVNTTFENMVDYAMSDYAWFIDSLKGCAYSTDVPGAVKNVSSLNPLELALVTDNKEIFEKRAYPTIEYQISREKFLFALDKEQKIQHPSRKLHGPIAPISELTSLYNIFGHNMPFLMTLANGSYVESKIRNLDVVEEGSSWMNSMFMYKASGDRAYLEKAKNDADEYIEARINKSQTDFSDPLAGGFFFWTGYAPRWIYLLELYEITKEQRYLEAAQKGARYYTMFCWMSPRIPDEDVTVNEGGKAPHYWYLRSKGHPQMMAEEESVPAWRLSEIGLTPESSGTSTGHRAIFMANYAPWMLRLGYYAQDDFLKEVAKAAIVGRYRNFPGYHINTGRTTVYEAADYPLRPHKELSVNSFHYNHIMPQASMLLDYLVTDAFVKSDGQIDFPSDFIEGYAYLQNKFYGHKAGSWYGEEAWLWMPPQLVETGSVELNYISARKGDKLYIALSNQSQERVDTWIKVNTDYVEQSTATAMLQNGKKLKVEDGKILVRVPAVGQLALCLEGVKTNVSVQNDLLSGKEAWSNDFTSVNVANAKAMIIAPGDVARNLYLYTEDDDDMFSQITLLVKQNGEEKRYTDRAYPYEFTVPVLGENVDFKIIAKRLSGKNEISEWTTLNK